MRARARRFRCWLRRRHLPVTLKGRVEQGDEAFSVISTVCDCCRRRLEPPRVYYGQFPRARS